MSLCRFLARRIPGFRLQNAPNLVGARGSIFRDFSARPWGAYRGPIIEHVLLVVEAGIAAFERDGVRWEAHKGDALLLPAGQGGRLEFVRCPIREEVAVEIFVFDERSIAGLLRRFSAWENLALEEDCSPEGMLFRHFHSGFDSGRELRPQSINRFKFAIGTLLDQYRPGLGGFLRKLFYWRRWMVAVFMERFVTTSGGIEIANTQYAGGAKQLRKDCLLYLGAEAGTVLARRRCELAKGWLRCGHPIADVAKALGYSSAWEFECEFAGTTKIRCRDVQCMIPLIEAAPEELISAMQPFWWGGDRKLLVEQPIAARMFPDSMVSEREERRMIEADPSIQERARQNIFERESVAGELRELSEDFLAMKSTGPEVIVPIFKFAKPQTVAA